MDDVDQSLMHELLKKVIVEQHESRARDHEILLRLANLERFMAGQCSETAEQHARLDRLVEHIEERLELTDQPLTPPGGGGEVAPPCGSRLLANPMRSMLGRERQKTLSGRDPILCHTQPPRRALPHRAVSRAPLVARR